MRFIFAFLFLFTAGQSWATSDDWVVPSRGNGGSVIIAPKDATGTAQTMMTFDPTNGVSGSGFAGKNYLINGGAHFNQRLDRGTDPGGTPVYGGPDRWATATGSITAFFAFGTVANNWVSVPKTANSLYFDLTPTTSAVWVMEQRIESSSAQLLNGKTVTVSFWYYGGAATGTTNLAVELWTPTSLDTWSSESLYATSGESAYQNNTVYRIVKTFTIGSTTATNGLAVRIKSLNPTQTTRQIFRYAEIMLNEGSTAAPFQLAGGSIGGELALAQRYFYHHSCSADTAIIIGTGYISGATAGTFYAHLPTVMRTTPVISVHATAANLTVLNYINTGFYTPTIGSVYQSGNIVGFAVSSTGMTAGLAALRCNSTAGFMDFSSEL